MIQAVRKRGRAEPEEPTRVRAAAYARISVADRESVQFSSVEAQVEAIAAYIKSQDAAGWTLVGEPYIDDGYSGAKSDRPALTRMLNDATEGKIDVVVVHRFDRFSRSQRDFLNLLQVLEDHEVSFVSVTQRLDTSTPMGRCMLSVMTAFAQLEREVIAERTRDKILASRRKGLWTGGRPVLGYDLVEKQLTVNKEESERVRAIYDLYLEFGALLPVVDELKRRGWKTKTWTNQKGELVHGRPFTKPTLHHFLRNPLYAGKVRCGAELHDGAHEAIVEQETWDRVQLQLREHGQGTPPRQSRSSALLAGLIRCGVCGAGMTPHASRKGARQYHYYVCQTNQKHGAKACPGSRVGAGELEAFVLDRIREIGRDPLVLEATLEADRRDQQLRRPGLVAESRRLVSARSAIDGERSALVDAIAKGKTAPALAQRLGERDEELREVERRQAEVREELASTDTGTIDPDELREALRDLEPIWAELFPKERARVLGLLIEEVRFDSASGEVEIAFRPDGPNALGGGAKP